MEGAARECAQKIGIGEGRGGRYNSFVLSIVSTPIGNLGDITLRALEVLKSCDGIVCEDTRVTGQLLKLLNLPKKPLTSLHSYSKDEKVESILNALQSGKHLALVSDAGTPCIADPGYVLVSEARSRGTPIEVIPGPSAFLAALSASGLPINQCTYLGFLPVKKGRQRLLQSFKTEPRTIVFYESPHRIQKTLSEFAEILKDQPSRRIVIARELTKLYEGIVSTTMSELLNVARKLTVKGEFAIVVEGMETRASLRKRIATLEAAQSRRKSEVTRRRCYPFGSTVLGFTCFPLIMTSKCKCAPVVI